MVHDEFLIQWVLVLPWRQRNIRECRIGLKSEGASLFKVQIEQWDTVAKPRWVQEKLRANPNEQLAIPLSGTRDQERSRGALHSSSAVGSTAGRVFRALS